MKIFKLFQLFAFSCLIGCSSEDGHDKQREKLDNEIKELNHQLTAYRIKEMNLEIESQSMMRAEWSEFAKNLKEAEKEELLSHQLEKKIQALQKQRDELQKKSSP
jgi:hypothetical protein